MSAAIICAARESRMDLRREAPVRIRSAGIGLVRCLSLPEFGLSDASACRYAACPLPVRCLSLPVFDNSLRFL